MMYRYTIFRPDGTSEAGEVDWPPDPRYDDIAKLIGQIVGGPIEHVRILDPTKATAEHIGRADYRDMFVDELGHMRKPPAARNEMATALYRANWLRVHPQDDPESLSFIAGLAVVFERVIWR
jgi:hypothetical protein